MASEAVSVEQKIVAAVARCSKDRDVGRAVNVTALCAELEISRPTFYKYEQRFARAVWKHCLPR